ncbi:6-phosphogluconate dehydrogenase [bacterium SCGC AG-212-C10]|nr:6-phosphogluconate dehydrogenase [bacterium SCGC AG-212-C10]
MEIGMIGLGRMGGNMARRLLLGGHRVVGFAEDPAGVQALEAAGGLGVGSLEELVANLAAPRAVWMMVPSGAPTEATTEKLSKLLSRGDVLIDGGNSNYKDSMRRAEMVKPHGISYVDAGTSGGVWGLAEGYAMMVGGENEAIARIRPILETLAPAADAGWGHVGPSGSGHFVKMIHNGIEYGLMQAYAEGFEILKAKSEFNLDLAQISEVWRRGSVVRSWLLDLTARALAEDQELSTLKGYVSDSGEGRWTVAEAIDLDVPAPVISLSLMMRFVSRQDDSYAARLLAAMRNQFGGHPVVLAEPPVVPPAPPASR